MKLSNVPPGISVSCALMLVLLAPVASAAQARGARLTAPEQEVFTALEAEAEALRTARPELWQSYLEQANRVFEEHERTACWQCRGVPQPADISPLKLPLPFLVAAVQQLWSAGDDVPKAGYRIRSYYNAMMLNADPRRVYALLGVQAKRGDDDYAVRRNFGRLIAGAADLEWATGKIRELLGPDPPLDPHSLLNALLWQFAPRLPKDLQAAAYDYVRRHWKGVPVTHLGDDAYWDLLLSLDPERARAEIIPHFETYEYSLYVVLLLKKHAGPSPQVARAVRRWTTTGRGKDWPQYTHVLLLKSDPRGELGAFVAYIDGRVAELKAQKREGDPFFLGDYLRALMEIDSDEAVPPLARYANEQLLSDIARLEVVEWLVRRRYEGAPQVVARWLAEEEDYRRGWLRQAVEKGEWGDEGRRVLREAEAVNLKKTPAPPPGGTAP